MGVEELMKEVVEQLEKLITTKTVIGEPITAAGKTLIPISRVTFGFGSGGGEGKRDAESGFGGGGGGGAKIEPVAFLVVSEDDVRMLTIKEKGMDIKKIIETVPELVDAVKTLKGKKGLEKSEESAE